MVKLDIKEVLIPTFCNIIPFLKSKTNINNIIKPKPIIILKIIKHIHNIIILIFVVTDT